jgi:enoyl-CoA hydratase
MDPESAVRLYDAFESFENDQEARVAVLWGEGGAFCAGYDLKRAATIKAGESKSEFDFSPDDASGKTQSRGLMGPTRMQLSKPVIAAIAGPAVAGGMELAIWADLRVMEESAYMGVYCRRWGVPLVDGGTVRLPRLVGEGRAMDLILTGRKVMAQEALSIGLCEYISADGQARADAEKLAADIARFPQHCLRTDRVAARKQHGLSLLEALQAEWRGGKSVITQGLEGAERFASGLGRGGDFDKI